MSDSIWISPFIEHCLSSYQTEENLRPDRELTWEDDGSNIRFPSSAQQNALINDWNEGDNLPTAKLTDSDTQIDATLSRGSLDEYKSAFPREPLSKDRCRGFLIQLDTFELVYEYSTGKPNVHLYVKRFNIIWDRGKTKSPPTGKIIRKKPALALLMRQVYTRTKSRDQQARKQYKAKPGSDGGFGDKHAIQAINGHAYASTQALLLSQLPSHVSADSRPSHDLVYDAPLLPDVPRPESPETLRPSRERSMETQPLDRSSVPVRVGHSRGTSSVSTTSNKPPGSPRTQESEKTTETKPPPLKKHFESRPAGAQANTNHPSVREAISPAHAEPDSLDQPIERRGSPYSPEKQLNSQLQASQSVTLRPRNPATTTHQNLVDPWEGMAGIKSVDVTVPEDQAELLGHAGKGQWYPPLPGLPTISGHVPPALLHEWNMFVLQRSRRATGSGLDSPEASGPSDRNTPSAESDSDGSRRSISWESSPERTPRRGMVLPVDSSPIKGRSVSRAPQQKSPDAHEGTSKDETSNSRVTNENHPSSGIGQDNDLSVTTSSRIARSDPTARVVPPTVAHGTDKHESDISSSDSEMDVVVPQPLSGSTQQGGQMEPEIPSSGPLLPEPSRHIQVAETPSVALHKPRTMIFNQSDTVSGSSNPNVSPYADKSSSQSRILNTYASHDGDSKGETSQDTHVVDTPINSQALQTRDSTYSQSSSLLTSSAPKSTESNVAIAVSTFESQPSNAFSSYRELPSSSMLSVEEQQRSPSIQSSTRASPFIPTSALPLKRGISEVEIDGDIWPSKKTKPDQKSMVSEAEMEVDAKLRYRNFRFQECITSAQSIAAKQVYERFCGNYPTYHGDYAHFTKLCSKLQAFRALGSLQRSFLWDDFIIKHLEEYPAYLGECMAKETKSLPYEQFFATFFSKPTHKRRILSAEAIDACAAQVIAIDETLMVSSSEPTTDTKVSFTSSIRDQLSNFHTYSFAAMQKPESQEIRLEATQDGNDNVSDYSIPDSEPIRAAAQIVAHEIPEDLDNDETMGDAEDMDDTVHETASVELGDEESTRLRTAPSDDESMDDPLGDSLANDANFALDVTPNDQPGKSFDHKAGEAGREGRDNDDDDVDEHEIIASNPTQPAIAPTNEEEEDEVEETQEYEPNTTILTRQGADVEEIEDDDDRFAVAGDTAAKAPVEVDETASDSDPDELDSDPNENWFLALRNIHPNEPVWSDDANTPFKKWARADQNVFSVRNRRGGANVSTDEKGVVQLMNHTRR